MGRNAPRFLAVGHLTKAHGLRGELLVTPLTDHPEGSFAPGVVLRLGTAEDGRPDPDLPPLRVASARPFRSGWLVRFGGVEERTQAERLRGSYLMRDVDELEPLEEGELFYHELLGMRVVTRDGARVGEIREVYELESADLLEVRDGARTIMVPFLASIVVEIDREGSRLVIDPPEGLLEL